MKVSELLNDSSRWIKGEYARNSTGKEVDEYSPEAVCFCLHGAIQRCYPHFNTCQEVVAKVKAEIFPITITSFNDAPSTTFSDIQTLVTKLDI